MTMNWIIKASVAIGLLGALVAPSACGGSGGSSTAECMADSDCASGEVCDPESASCVMPDTSTGCKSNTDCNPDETCDTTSGFCIFAGCTMDSECLMGDTCDTATGECKPGPTPPTTTCHQCACVDILSMGGCANVCDMAQNGTTTPNFCNGMNALPQCTKCLADNCGSLTDAPNPTDPSACM